MMEPLGVMAVVATSRTANATAAKYVQGGSRERSQRREGRRSRASARDAYSISWMNSIAGESGARMVGEWLHARNCGVGVYVSALTSHQAQQQSRSRNRYSDIGCVPLHQRGMSRTYKWLKDLLKEALCMAIPRPHCCCCFCIADTDDD